MLIFIKPHKINFYVKLWLIYIICKISIIDYWIYRMYEFLQPLHYVFFRRGIEIVSSARKAPLFALIVLDGAVC